MMNTHRQIHSNIWLHHTSGLCQESLPVIDHVLLGLGDVLQVDDDDVLEVRYSIMLKQLHLNLINQMYEQNRDVIETLP